MSDLTGAWHAAMKARNVTNSHIKTALDASNSADPEQSTLANSVLFLAGDPASRDTAFARLKEMCTSPKWQDPKAVAFLLLILNRFSRQQLFADVDVAGFVYGCAAHAAVPVRLNSLILLRRLAKFGEQKAMELLKQCVSDPNPYVRETAAKQLKLAGREGG